MSFSKTRRINVLEKFGKRCAYCGKIINFNDFHIDHIKPKKEGGNSKIENLNPACQDCNLSKSSLSLEEYRNKIFNLITDNHIGRIVKSYYKIKPRKIVFFFENNVKTGG